jgi:hypothetical protein
MDLLYLIFHLSKTVAKHISNEINYSGFNYTKLERNGW